MVAVWLLVAFALYRRSLRARVGLALVAVVAIGWVFLVWGQQNIRSQVDLADMGDICPDGLPTWWPRWLFLSHGDVSYTFTPLSPAAL
jgi:hypothetical protein